MQGTLALGSEKDWVSDGLYEGSSTAATEIDFPVKDFPAEVLIFIAVPRSHNRLSVCPPLDVLPSYPPRLSTELPSGIDLHGGKA